MLYQGIIGGGSSPVEPEDLSPVLLWTNTSTTSAFTAQTVSLDLTEYAGVIVDFNESTSGISMTRVFCKKSESSYFGAGGAPNGEGFGRSFNITNEGVVFGQAYALNVVNNNYVVPSKIYGVKEYVVEPVSRLSIPEEGNGTDFSNSLPYTAIIGHYYLVVMLGADKDNHLTGCTVIGATKDGNQGEAISCIVKATSTTLSFDGAYSGRIKEIVLN